MNTSDSAVLRKKISANHKKVVEFIPFKTMHMDLESILANVTRIYINRHDTAMVELLSLSKAELFPIGSFDAEAEKYEYVLQLAIPVKFYNHLKAEIVDFEPRLFKDLSAITAPYNHEFISEVVIVISIDQDSGWRDTALDWVSRNGHLKEAAQKESDFAICHACGDNEPVVEQLKKHMVENKIKASARSLFSTKDRDFHHVLKEIEKESTFCLFIISPEMLEVSFPSETLDQITRSILDPDKKFFQIWHGVSRADVANFSSPLARSLAFSTERMTVEEICGLLLQITNLGQLSNPAEPEYRKTN